MSSLAGLVIAKGSSKRLPQKNRLDLNGKPMFLWNVQKLLRIVPRVYVSSDDPWILDEAEWAGAIPIKRPPELCGETPNIPVYQHALGFMNGVDGIIAVQANSPTIDSHLIEIAKELLLAGFKEIMTMHKGGSIYGSIWAIRADKLRNYGDPYKPNPSILLVDSSIDIHTQEDFIKALKQI